MISFPPSEQFAVLLSLFTINLACSPCFSSNIHWVLHWAESAPQGRKNCLFIVAIFLTFKGLAQGPKPMAQSALGMQDCLFWQQESSAISSNLICKVSTHRGFWDDYVLEVKGKLLRTITGRCKETGTVQVLARTLKGRTQTTKKQTYSRAAWEWIGARQGNMTNQKCLSSGSRDNLRVMEYEQGCFLYCYF